ncbi:hypothetical protein [Winogradskyella sp. A3E31]|uniref:hypothetical protein n=1 Tax=Winogradskyella sp. A3E31 TaxID=3349637 RepID=UPI00398B55A2
MKKIAIFIIVLIGFSSFADAQVMRRGGRMQQNRIPQSQPSEEEIKKQQEKFEKEMKERQEEYIANFLTTLDADAFQKEIIKQTINEYFEKKIALFKIPYERVIEREDAVKNLNKTHFEELKKLISESDMEKINAMIEGDFEEKDVKKKKKKRRKKDKG